MNNSFIPSIIRFIGLLLLQVLVLKQITPGWASFHYMQIFIYPLFIMLLPFRTPRAAVLLSAFAIGIAVDLFYDSPGLHASASVFIAYIRPGFIRWLEPRGGYNINHSPSKAYLGWPWFLRFASLMLITHLFFYFSVESFTFVYIIDILLKTVVSFAASMLFILMMVAIFNPKD